MVDEKDRRLRQILTANRNAFEREVGRVEAEIADYKAKIDLLLRRKEQLDIAIDKINAARQTLAHELA